MATKYLCDWCGEDVSYPDSSFMRIDVDWLKFNEECEHHLTPYKYEISGYEGYLLCPDCYEELTKPLLTKRLVNKLHEEN